MASSPLVTTIRTPVNNIQHNLLIWEPIPPMGYRALGYVVTTHSNIMDAVVPDLKLVSHVFNFGCLINSNFQATMPNLDQVKALIHHYGPRVYFHPDEVYLPSSVPWFLKNRADQDTFVRQGCLETVEVYVHVKPAVGGTFTDFDMWLFFPFKGPDTSTLKLFNFNIEMINKMVGEHVGHWEHFTLRISNFDGHLWMLYFPVLKETDKLGVEASCLKFVKGTNKSIVYSSKFRHTTFPNDGSYIQGRPTKLGIRVMDHAGKSDMFIDTSKKYKIIGTEYLGDGVVVEPGWMRKLRPEKIPGHLT
ncbi:vacuolar protein sorting-associated protein 62 [Tanacetum coccineum]